MKLRLITSILFLLTGCLLAGSALAQYTTVTHLTGTSTYGSHAVTATPTGATSSITYCSTSPYWIGTSGPATYTFDFSPTVSAVRYYITAANTGEAFSFYVNGSRYSLTSANLFAFSGSCGSPAILLSGDSLLTPTVAGSPGAAVGVNIFACEGISSVQIRTNGLLAGSVFTFQFSDTAVCTASNNGPLCPGDTLKLFAAGGSADTFRWTGPGGYSDTGQAPIRTNVSYADTGTYRVIVSARDTYYTHVTLRLFPAVSAGSNSPVCISGTVNLTAGPDSLGQTYAWSGPRGFTSTLQNPSISGASVADTGVYTLITARNGCYDTDRVLVAVGDPVPVHLGADTSFCAGNTVTLRSSDTYTGPSYLWSTGSTTATLNVSVSGSYWLRVTTGGCYSYDTVNVVVKALPHISLGPDTAFCSGTTLRLNPTPSGRTSFTWSTGASTGSLPVSAAGVYWVVADSNGCTRADTIQIAEKPNPVVTLGPDISVCAGSGVTLYSTTSYTAPAYLWSTGATTPTISPVTSGSYRLTVTQRGCSATDTINVTFRRHPLVNLGPDTAFCYGGSYTMSVPSGSTTYLWNTGNTTNVQVATTTGTYAVLVDSMGCTSADTINVVEVPSFVVDLGRDTTLCTLGNITLQSLYTYTVSPIYRWSTGGSMPAETVAASGTYWLSVNQRGCVRADSIVVTIKYDSIFLQNRDTAICKGQSVQAIATTRTTGGTYTYQWLPTTGVPLSTTLNPLITPDTTAVYYLLSQTTGCPPIMDSFRIDVQPVPSVYAGGNRRVCQYDTIRLAAAVSPAWYTRYNYSWSPATDLDNPNIHNPIFTAGGTQKYIVTVTTPTGCVGKDSLLVTVSPGNFLVPPTDTAVCPLDSFRFVVSGASSYRWWPALYLSDSTSSAPWVKAITSQQYMVIGTSGNGCTDTARVTVTVHPAGVIALEDSAEIYPGNVYRISPETNCTIMRWFPATGLDNPDIIDPVANPEISTRYSVIGITAKGCKTSDTIVINVQNENVFALPNAFNPQGTTNPKFAIIVRGEVGLHHFRIYNRWGNLVFETTDINEGWDGTYKGAPQPFGVYVYDVEAVNARGTVIKRTGNVTLIR